MSFKKANGWIIGALITCCAIGGLLMWDANDYPIIGVPEAPPTPFELPIWEKDVPLTTSLSRIQDRLRRKRFIGLKE